MKMDSISFSANIEYINFITATTIPDYCSQEQLALLVVKAIVLSRLDLCKKWVDLLVLTKTSLSALFRLLFKNMFLSNWNTVNVSSNDLVKGIQALLSCPNITAHYDLISTLTLLVEPEIGDTDFRNFIAVHIIKSSAYFLDELSIKTLQSFLKDKGFSSYNITEKYPGLGVFQNDPYCDQLRKIYLLFFDLYRIRDEDRVVLPLEIIGEIMKTLVRLTIENQPSPGTLYLR